MLKKTGEQVQNDLLRPMYEASKGYWIALGVAASLVLAGIYALCYQMYNGIGVWGLNSPVFWAFDITNFVFWIGIGHAGTLISAILCLLRQRWRTSINRSAEAMTLFAVACAGIFPVVHTGRVWYALMPPPLPPQPVSLPQLPPLKLSRVPPTLTTFGDSAGKLTGAPVSPLEAKNDTPA